VLVIRGFRIIRLIGRTRERWTDMG